MNARLIAFCIALATLSGFAADHSANAPMNDGVDRNDPNFVTASLLVFGPGDELFSCVGHACIRLECPHFKLDYCFSYESERAVERLPKFFAGKLKMGLFAIPTDEFLMEYVESGRGLRQYRMNLPPSVKQRLWKIMDGKAAEGANLPYDYNKRGCAKSAYQCILDALAGVRVERTPWIAANAQTRREKFCEMLKDTHPWNIFFLNAIVGTETDNVEEVVVPKDLLAVLRKMRVEGVPVVSGDGVELLPQRGMSSPSIVTPIVVAWFLVVLSVILFFLKNRAFDLIFVGFQACAGLFFAYLVSASGLPTSCWNWLLIPFNPLPLVFWRWRRYWAWTFVAVLLAWEAFMLLFPHQLTDLAYLVIVLAYVIFYAKVARTPVTKSTYFVTLVWVIGQMI